MLRSALTTRSLAILAAGFLVTQMTACSSSSNGGGNGSGGNNSSSGGNKGSGGSSASGGSNGSGSGSGGKVGSGGSGTSSGGSSGSGGSKGSGGSGTSSGGSSGSGGSTGSGGTGTTGSGGSGTTGSGGSGTTGSGGSGTTGSGGSGTTGSGGSMAVGGNPDCPTGANTISDFEEGTTGITLNPGGGIWYDYKGKGTIMPATVAATTTPTGIATATDGSGMCKGALHIQTTGATDYSGFGATLAPAPTSASLNLAKAVDVSAHKGISFKIKSGSGTPAAIYFDMKTKESAPMAEGGNLSDGATGASPSTNIDEHVGLRNNRGQMLLAPWTATAISSSWQTITVPFSTLVPRWMPAGTNDSNGCPTSSGAPKCQAPAFVPKDVLGIEFSALDLTAFGIMQPSGATAGTYDIWIDDVAWVDDDSGLPTLPGFPLAGAGDVGMCSKPTHADGKTLVTAYNEWKHTFAKDGAGPVIRPENANDVVSEGIAYGMLLAVNFNDQKTFDSLYSYWKGHSTNGLMDWCQPSTGSGGTNSACSAMGGGSATDADEDAAFALIQAGKVFGGGTYASDAATMIGAIWSKDIDSAAKLPTGGSNYGNSVSSQTTNPSYFAPAYYRIFATIDKATGHDWNGVADNSIAAIAKLSNKYGLVPAWCTNSCTKVDTSRDSYYQYDAHRVPMRVGLDYCWNGTAAAQSYTTMNTTFFATNKAAGANGIGFIADLYTLADPPDTQSGWAPNSASVIGTAAVGAMASKNNQQFLDDAYQSVFDEVTRGTLAPVASMKTPYSYYNATVGLLTLLIMTGNFSH